MNIYESIRMIFPELTEMKIAELNLEGSIREHEMAKESLDKIRSKKPLDDRYYYTELAYLQSEVSKAEKKERLFRQKLLKLHSEAGISSEQDASIPTVAGTEQKEELQSMID